MQGQVALLHSGQQVGDFVIEAEQGRGGMAVVYRAQQVSLKRTVALKLMLPQISIDPQAVVRFQQEAQHAARLSHPHIVTIYGTGELMLPNGLTVPYIAMQYVAGATLRELIQHEPVSLEQATTILTQVAQALDYAHSYGMIHRDIKPSNILLSTTGVAYLTDFGLATAIGSGRGLTRSGMVIGTPEYMAPEQAEGRGQIGTTADVYALGLVLYEMLTGKLPFEADTPMGIMLARLLHPPRDLHELRPDLPPALATVIQTALARDPAQRYPTAGALAAALHALEPSAAGNASNDAPTVVVAPVAAHSPPLAATPVIGATVSMPNEHMPLVATPAPPLLPAQPDSAAVQTSAHSRSRTSNTLLGYGLIGLGGVALLLVLLMRINPLVVRVASPLLLGIGTFLSIIVIVQSLSQRGRAGAEHHVQRTRLLGVIGVGLVLLGGLSANQFMPQIAPDSGVTSPPPALSYPVPVLAEGAIPRSAYDESSLSIYFTYARGALEQGNYSAARDWLEPLLESASSNAQLHTLLGHSYVLEASAMPTGSAERAQAAQNAVEAYMQVHQGSAELEAGLGWAYRYLGNFREARAHFESALNFEDKYEPALSGLAWTLYDSAEYQRAADLFEEALDELDDTTDPSAKELYLGLAQSLEMVQDYDEAIEAYEKALEFDRDNDLILSAIERLKQFR